MLKKLISFIKREIKPFNSLFAILMYGVFSLIYTYPLIRYIFQYVIGDLEGDMWKHVWGFWWVKRRLIDEGELPLFTSLLNYPYGGNLFFIDPLGAIWSLPLQYIFPVQVVYNIIVLANLIFGAFCAYLLAGYFIKNKEAAFYSGAVYAFTAYMLAYITSGVSETYNIAWIPLFLYFFARMLHEEGELFPILAGVSLFMCALGAFYYGNFATILAVFFLIAFGWFLYRKAYPRSAVKTPKKENLLEKMNLLDADPEISKAVASVAKHPHLAGLTDRGHGVSLLGIISSSFSRGGRKTAGFKGWLQKTLGRISLLLVVFCLAVTAFVLPGLLYSPVNSGLPVMAVFYGMIGIFAISLVYSVWYYKPGIRNLSYSLQGLFYSKEQGFVKIKMYLIFGLYTIGITGILNLGTTVRLAGSGIVASVGIIAVSSLLIALIMTYMQMKGEKKSPGSAVSVDKTAAAPSSANEFGEYAAVIVPWLAMFVCLGNMLRIVIFYQDITQSSGVGGIAGGLAVSALIFIAVLIHIINKKLYLRWNLLNRLYFNPELPEEKNTPAEKSKTIRKNLIITGFLILSIVIPPVALYAQGFSPERYMKYWFAFTGVVIAIGAIVFALSKTASSKIIKPEPGERPAGIFDFFNRWARQPFRKLLIMGIVAGSLILPLFITFKASLSGAAGLVKRERSIEFIDLYLSKRFRNVSMLADYVTMGKDHINRTYTVDRLTRTSYAGWLTIILAIAGIVMARKRKYIWFWTFCALFFISFSLGPYLYVTENIHLKWRFFLYILFYQYFPFFNQISIPYRFNIIAMLSLGVLAGYGLTQLFRGWSKTQQRLLVSILSLAMLFEVCLLSPAPYPIPLSDLHVPSFYQEIAKDSEDFGIIDSPIQRVKGELLPGEYFYYQMFHGKGIPYKVEGTIPVYIYENQFTVYLFNLEKGYSISPPDEKLLRQYLDELKKNRIKYIVVHNQYLKNSARERVHTYLQNFLGKPTIYERDLYVYKIY
ncbi:MAG: hypothetical protein LWY06_17915 [Firmicutes bacterium]|nr:hypothetical protein [Bacillota bacterium]